MRIYSATDVGQKRKMNQDYVFASSDPIGNLPNLFVVADGMGGHNAGDYASSHAVSVVVEEIRQDRDFNPVKVIRHAIESANREIIEQAQKDDTALAQFLDGLGEEADTSSSETSADGTMLTVTEGCNVRAEANSDSEIIGGLDEGDQVQKMGQEGDWIQIEYDGQTGYVYSGLLQ